jgi:hypothetical protein
MCWSAELLASSPSRYIRKVSGEAATRRAANAAVAADADGRHPAHTDLATVRLRHRDCRRPPATCER